MDSLEEDVWEPEQDIYWGAETEWLGDKRYSGDRELENPLGAVQMGLIYVNPEGPNGNPDPIAAARDIRETFGRMAMNDEETVALIAGGHTFGKAHGAEDPDKYVSREPAGATIEEQSSGWKNSYGSGAGEYTITSGLEGAWTAKPTEWTNMYFDNLFGHEWELTKSPAGAQQWKPKNGAAADTVPDAHNPSVKHAPMMLTTDLALRMDPSYNKISKSFHENPDAFADAFARAWYKLTHRDMGPITRYLGPEVPSEELIWQDPIPQTEGAVINDNDIDTLKSHIKDSNLSVSELVSTAWASASTYRQTDKRGGANGARIRLAPQKFWAVNNQAQLSKVLSTYEELQSTFNSNSDRKVSIADLIVLGGNVGIEKAASAGGQEITVPFTAGRADATQEQTDIDSFSYLEPPADGFRNYLKANYKTKSEDLLVDKAHLLGLSTPEMVVLLGGMRVLGTNYNNSNDGVFTKRPGILSNDYFVNLLDLDTTWKATTDAQDTFIGSNRKTGEQKWTGSRVDLICGSNSELRAIAEVYGSSDSAGKFTHDFIAAWTKVMNLDRFDI